MDNRDEKYLSYMLRLWQARTDAGGSWRASLEDPRTGQRTGFAGLEELFGYLSRQTLGAVERAQDPWSEEDRPEGGQ